MAKYRVVYTYVEVGEDTIEADSFEQAEMKWRDEGWDAQLEYIEDSDGNYFELDTEEVFHK